MGSGRLLSAFRVSLEVGAGGECWRLSARDKNHLAVWSQGTGKPGAEWVQCLLGVSVGSDRSLKDWEPRGG